MPIAHITIPFSIPCSAARSGSRASRSSPSSSFAITKPSSLEDCIFPPRHGGERLRLHLQRPRDRLRELLRVVEHDVHPPRAAPGGELEEVVEVRVVAERELRVEPVHPREVV